MMSCCLSCTVTKLFLQQNCFCSRYIQNCDMICTLSSRCWLGKWMPVHAHNIFWWAQRCHTNFMRRQTKCVAPIETMLWIQWSNFVTELNFYISCKFFDIIKPQTQNVCNFWNKVETLAWKFSIVSKILNFSTSVRAFKTFK